MKWNALVNDDKPYTIAVLFLSMLLYSYYKKPFRILCGVYVLSSLAFITQFSLDDVQKWVTFPLAVLMGVGVSAVVAQEVNPAFFYPHFFVSLFGLTPIGPTWVIFPLLYCAMTALAGYKRLTAYCIPTLVVSAILSSQIGAAPLVALCTSATMLVPFSFLCPLFDKEIPFDPV